MYAAQKNILEPEHRFNGSAVATNSSGAHANTEDPDKASSVKRLPIKTL